MHLYYVHIAVVYLHLQCFMSDVFMRIRTVMCIYPYVDYT